MGDAEEKRPIRARATTVAGSLSARNDNNLSTAAETPLDNARFYWYKC